jgi:hypothetical protein
MSIDTDTPPTPQLGQDMVERISQTGPVTGAEALRQLRSAFPDSPLSLRVKALGMLSRRADSAGTAGVLKPDVLR